MVYINCGKNSSTVVLYNESLDVTSINNSIELSTNSLVVLIVFLFKCNFE